MSMCKKRKYTLRSIHLETVCLTLNYHFSNSNVFHLLERCQSSKKLVGTHDTVPFRLFKTLLRFRVLSMKTICLHISCKKCENAFGRVHRLFTFVFRLLRRQEEQCQSYEDILQMSKALNNRACVQTLYQRLKKRFEHFPVQNNDSEATNDILHMTLIDSFKR